MKKRIVSILCITVLILSLFPGYTKGSVIQAETQKKFTVGFDAEFPPYGYRDDNGEYVGFDLDLAEEVCNRNGWELIKKPIDWDSKNMELNSGMIDCIWNGFTMDGLEDKYTWSDPYVDNSQVVVVKKDSGIEVPTDLAGKTVVVQADSSALHALEGEDASAENKELAESFKELRQVKDYNSAFMNLESGMVDAVCLDIGVASYEVDKRGEEFVILEQHISTEQYGVGFKKGNTKLRDQVQKTLYEMQDDKTFDRIAEKWKLSSSVCLAQSEKEAQLEKEETKKEDNSGGSSLEETFTSLGKGMVSTLAVFFLTLLFALPLGLLVAAGRMSKFKVVQLIVKFYISVMRGTPLMLQLLVVYFGPYYIARLKTPAGYLFYAVIIAFVINYAAYYAEIYRSGIQSIPVGQYEAAKVLGYSRIRTFWKIIFPQMVKRVLPPMTNEIITLVKDTSLASAIAYTEMFVIAKRIAAADASIAPLFIAGLFYYIFNFLVAFLMEKVEKKLSYYQ